MKALSSLCLVLVAVFVVIDVNHAFWGEKEHHHQESKEKENQDSKASVVRPMTLEPIGDTSHLFNPIEDFPKKTLPKITNNNQEQESETETGKSKNSKNHHQNKDSSNKKNNKNNSYHQVNCLYSNITIAANDTSTRYRNAVKLVNGSRLTHLISNSPRFTCFLVLFYVPWCPFSTRRVAPIFNVLPWSFPKLDILAFDVSKSVGYNTKFGTSAVPMILLFQNRNIIGKFNYSSANYTDYVRFVERNTGFNATTQITKEKNDNEEEEKDSMLEFLYRPVPEEPIKSFDYSLLFSWIFVCAVFVDQVVMRRTRFVELVCLAARRVVNFLRPEKRLELPAGPMRQAIQQQPDLNHQKND